MIQTTIWVRFVYLRTTSFTRHFLEVSTFKTHWPLLAGLCYAPATLTDAAIATSWLVLRSSNALLDPGT